MLEFVQLSKRYGEIWANRDITLDLRSGSVVGLLGPNGAGKTTLLRQLVGLTRPTSGVIRVGGRTVVPGQRWIKEKIAYLPQHPLALGDLTVAEAIRSSALLRGLSRPDAEERTQTVVHLLDLESLLNRQVGQLSGGEHRLVGVACLAVAPTPIMALDEPTNELDPLMRRRIWDFIQNLRHPERVVLLVSHNVLEAEKVLDRVIIMSHGRVRHDGTPESLRRNTGDLLKVNLHVSRGLEQVTAELAGQASIIRTSDLTVEFAAPRAAALTLLAKWLSQPEVVHSVEVHEPSLEDAYLSLRQRSDGTASPEVLS